MYKASSVKGATWRSPLKNVNWKSFKVLSSHAPAGEHSAPGFQELLCVQERLQHPLVEQHVAHRLGYDYVHLDKRTKVRKKGTHSSSIHLLRNRDLLNFAADDLWLRCIYNRE